MVIVALLLLVALCAFPVLALMGFDRACNRLTGYTPERRVVTDPLTELSAELRRLSAEHDRLLRADVPGKPARLRAVQLAYDDTLLRAGATLAVELPPPPLGAVSRLQVEAELASAGFEW